jgi:Zn-dependent metalloprotease
MLAGAGDRGGCHDDSPFRSVPFRSVPFRSVPFRSQVSCLMAVMALGCGDLEDPAAPAAPQALEEPADSGGPPAQEAFDPEDAIAPDDLYRASPAAEAALETLRQAREAAGLVPKFDRSRPDAFQPIPGFGPDGLIVSRSPRGQINRIFGWPFLVEVAGPVTMDQPTERCRAFLQQRGDLWNLGSPGVALQHDVTKRDDLGGAHCVFRQTFDSVSVDRLQFVVHLDAKGRVTGANGQPVVEVADPTSPTVAATDAEAIAQATAPLRQTATTARLVIYSPAEHGDEVGRARLAWHVVRNDADGLPTSEVWVSAITGAVLNEASLEHHNSHNREVWDAEWQNTTSGVLRYRFDPFYWDSTNCGSGTDCLDIISRQITVSDMWWYWFGRNSYDGSGGTIRAVYDWCDKDNPADCGCMDNPQAVSKGNGIIVMREGTVDLDVISHEYGHEIQRSEMGVGTSVEGGAVGEHFADVNDIWADDYIGAQDWTNRICNQSLPVRRYDDPPGGGLNRGSDSWRWFMTPSEAKYGYHSNAGIMNKPAYLLHRTGTEAHHGVEVQGLGVPTARRIFYDAVDLRYFSAGAGMHAYRDGLVAACANRYGAGSNACTQLNNASHAAGLWSPAVVVSANAADRPTGYSWKGWGGSHWLYVFYRDAQNNIRWRWVAGHSGNWGPEATVVTSTGHTPKTNAPVAVAPVNLNGTEFLYVYYKAATSNEIHYFRMNSQEQFQGPWAIDPSIAQTNRGPAAVSSSQYHSVLFKVAGSTSTKLVRRTQGTVGSWQVGPTPPLVTDQQPHITEWWPALGVSFATARKSNGTMEYAALTVDSTWYSYAEPTGPGSSTPTQNNVAGPITQGHQQHWFGPPASGWGYGTPTTVDGPAAVLWKNGFVATYGTNAIGLRSNYLQVLAKPRWTGPTFVWGPRVPYTPLASSQAYPVKVETGAGVERALWFLERSSSSIVWRESRGGH